jgi:hypothetical protein
MIQIRISLLLSAIALLGACSEEQPPRSVHEFLENPNLLEATVVRCSQNRSETRYDPECVNAREAVSRMAAREEQAGRAALEAQSERKRDALRRTQEAAAEARRRTAEANRRREEAEYLAQFGQLPADATVDPDAIEKEIIGSGYSDAPATDGGNAPMSENATESDLGEVRDELRRRGEAAETD